MKFLAVSSNRADPSPWLAAENRRLSELVASGLVERTYLKADWSGAVLIVDAADEAAAARELATLPLVRGGITEFRLTEVLVPSPIG